MNMRLRIQYCMTSAVNTGYNYFRLQMTTNKLAMLKRKEKDVYKLRASQFNVETTQSQSTFQVQFCGPQNTPYELGKWKINLYLPEEYPYKSPSVGFLNRIFHPNIDFSSGSVCLDVINQTWTPMYELVNIFQLFLPQLLTYPNPASPLNHDAATLYEQDMEKYNEKVKQFVNKHALNQQLIQIRKKSEELLEEQARKLKQKAQNAQKTKSSGPRLQSPEEDSMDQEGSSISERNSIMDDDDLKLY